MANIVQIKYFSVPRSFLQLNSSGKYNQTCATAILENMGFSFPTKFLDVSLLSIQQRGTVGLVASQIFISNIKNSKIADKIPRHA